MDEFNSEKDNAKEVDSTQIEPNDTQNNSTDNNAQLYSNNNYQYGNQQNVYQQNANGVNNNQQNAYYSPNMGGNNQQDYLNSQQTNGAKKKEDKKNKTLIVVLIVFVISAVVALVAISGYLISDNKADDNSQNGIFSEEENSGNGTVEIQGSNEATKKDEDGNLTVAGVVDKVIDSCVGITVYAKQDIPSFFYGVPQVEQNDDGMAVAGEGSGVIMSEADGKTYIMTCAHVVENGDKYVVTMNDGSEYEAQLVDADSQSDIGVLSINAKGLKVAEFADSSSIELGEDCIAIGCPGGLEFMNSVTRGIVSALARPISSKIGYDNECIQVDAAINPGNSGGALFNMQGQVIGINSSKIADTNYEGMGFAVPSSTAVKIANSLIKYGYVEGRAKLGIAFNTLSNYRNANNILSALEQKGFKNAQGTMVIQEVTEDSGLYGKDIKQYDMIVAVNGKTMESLDVMTSMLSKSKPGDTVKLTIARAEGNSLKIFDVECELTESKD